MRTKRSPLILPIFTFALLLPAIAQAQIKSPGAHNDYSVELEPHFLLQWDNRPMRGDGVGVGMRATIPFLDNGPISSINNNMGIGFGLDWAHFSANYGNCFFGPYYRGAYYFDNCHADHFHFPVVVQWNFFLTPIVSVFGEAGIGIDHWNVHFDNCFYQAGYPYACDASDTGIEPLFWGGGRFQFGAKSPVSAVVRIGTPYISAGIGIMI